MLDATKSEEQRRLLEIELDAVGIRLNKKRPDVVFKRKTTGGVSISGHTLAHFLTHNLCRLPYVPSFASNTVLKNPPVDCYCETYQDRRKNNPDDLGELYTISLCTRQLLYLSSDKLHNCDVMIREDVRHIYCHLGNQIDHIPDYHRRIHRCSHWSVLSSPRLNRLIFLIGTRKYIPCLCMTST